jgi:hypothetical protein
MRLFKGYFTKHLTNWPGGDLGRDTYSPSALSQEKIRII